jgi:hypothetical protein
MAKGKCGWCGKGLTDVRARWCSKKHRQTAFRLRRLGVADAGTGDILLVDRFSGPKRLVYADPPYPGKAFYYKDRPDYAGEVDLVALYRSLQGYDGWALSTSPSGMRELLSLLPPEYSVGVHPWIKPHHQPLSIGPGNVHEYLLVSPARKLKPGPADALYAAVARQGDSDLIGRKPLKFIHWMFELLGAKPGDSFEDLFPGSGVVGHAWKEFARAADDTSLSVVPAPGDMSSRP